MTKKEMNNVIGGLILVLTILFLSSVVVVFILHDDGPFWAGYFKSVKGCIGAMLYLIMSVAFLQTLNMPAHLIRWMSASIENRDFKFFSGKEFGKSWACTFLVGIICAIGWKVMEEMIWPVWWPFMRSLVV